MNEASYVCHTGMFVLANKIQLKGRKSSLVRSDRIFALRICMLFSYIVIFLYVSSDVPTQCHLGVGRPEKRPSISFLTNFISQNVRKQ